MTPDQQARAARAATDFGLARPRRRRVTVAGLLRAILLAGAMRAALTGGRHG